MTEKSQQLSDEIRLLLISTVCGAVGAGIHALKSFTAFVGNRNLVSSWGWWYVASPVPGMVTGLFVYIAIRGGLLKTGNGVTVDVLNPYAVAAVAVVTGLFSDRILLKLAEYGDRKFLPKEQK